MKFAAALLFSLLLVAIPGCGPSAPAGPTKAELMSAYEIAKARYERAVKDAENATKAVELAEKAVADRGGAPTLEAEQHLNNLRRLKSVSDKSAERAKEEMDAALARASQ